MMMSAASYPSPGSGAAPPMNASSPYQQFPPPNPSVQTPSGSGGAAPGPGTTSPPALPSSVPRSRQGSGNAGFFHAVKRAMFSPSHSQTEDDKDYQAARADFESLNTYLTALRTHIQAYDKAVKQSFAAAIQCTSDFSEIIKDVPRPHAYSNMLILSSHAHKDLSDHLTETPASITQIHSLIEQQWTQHKLLYQRMDERAKLRSDYLYYSKKVEDLLLDRQRRSRPEKPTETDKIERNQEKLSDIRERYNLFNQELMNDLQMIYAVRLRIYGPAFALFIVAEKHYATLYTRVLAVIKGEDEEGGMNGEHKQAGQDDKVISVSDHQIIDPVVAAGLHEGMNPGEEKSHSPPGEGEVAAKQPAPMPGYHPYPYDPHLLPNPSPATDHHLAINTATPSGLPGSGGRAAEIEGYSDPFADVHGQPSPKPFYDIGSQPAEPTNAGNRSTNPGGASGSGSITPPRLSGAVIPPRPAGFPHRVQPSTPPHGEQPPPPPQPMSSGSAPGESSTHDVAEKVGDAPITTSHPSAILPSTPVPAPAPPSSAFPPPSQLPSPPYEDHAASPVPNPPPPAGVPHSGPAAMNGDGGVKPEHNPFDDD